MQRRRTKQKLQKKLKQQAGQAQDARKKPQVDIAMIKKNKLALE